MKKELVLILVALIVFSGCETLLFDRQPGDDLKSIPIEMQGKYIFYWSFYEDGIWQTEDTSVMVINENLLLKKSDFKFVRPRHVIWPVWA